MLKITPVLDIKEEEFIKELNTETTKIYFVGGCVRDHILGQKPKDIDLVVTGINMPELVTILQKYGRADLVGESFGVIKFNPHKCKSAKLADLGVIDIAIPRVEVKIGDKHKDFEVVASADITLEEDLLRRDFTMNSIAMDMNGEMIDPYNGFDSMINGILDCTSYTSFSDDPLRILRAFRFLARFNLKLSDELQMLLPLHIKDLNHITPERILEEFRKVHESCDNEAKHKYIRAIGGYHIRIGKLIIMDVPRIATTPLNTFADFIVVLLAGGFNKSESYLKELKGDNFTAKDIKALCIIQSTFSSNRFTRKISLIDAYKISDIGDRSDLFLSDELLQFRNRKVPRTVKDLVVDGSVVRELLVYKLGYPDSETGIALARIHQAVVLGSLNDTEEDAIWFINSNYRQRTLGPYHDTNVFLDKRARERILTPEVAWSRITG